MKPAFESKKSPVYGLDTKKGGNLENCFSGKTVGKNDENMWTTKLCIQRGKVLIRRLARDYTESVLKPDIVL